MGGPGKTGTACSHEKGHLFTCIAPFMSTSAVRLGEFLALMKCLTFAYINPVTPDTN